MKTTLANKKVIIVVLIIVVVTILLYFGLKNNLHLWPYNNPRNDVQKILKINNVPNWLKSSEVVSWQPDINYAPYKYFLKAKISNDEFYSFLSNVGLVKRDSNFPSVVWSLPDGLNIKNWTAVSSVDSAVDAYGYVDDTLGGVRGVHTRFVNGNVYIIIGPSILPTPTQIESSEDATYHLKDFGIKVGDDYVKAKGTLENKGWRTGGLDGDIHKIIVAGFPEISDCGSGRDAVCYVNFYKTPEDRLRFGFYVKQDISSKRWVVAGDVE